MCEVPVRCAKFIVRKQWIIAGTDDMHLRVYNYNTMDKVKAWEAHTDYIRYVEVHPNRPFVISSSDDMSIKLWDWEKDFECVQLFEGHVHYVMMVKINPRDTNTFASASLDRSIKVWGLTAGILPTYTTPDQQPADPYPLILAQITLALTLYKGWLVCTTTVHNQYESIILSNVCSV